MGANNKSVERIAAPLLRSTVGGRSNVPCALHRSSRRRSLTSDVGRHMRTHTNSIEKSSKTSPLGVS